MLLEKGERSRTMNISQKIITSITKKKTKQRAQERGGLESRQCRTI